MGITISVDGLCKMYQLELRYVQSKHSNLFCVLTGLNIILKVKNHNGINFLKIIEHITGKVKDKFVK
jgi:hypothetical protein